MIEFVSAFVEIDVHRRIVEERATVRVLGRCHYRIRLGMVSCHGATSR